MSGISARRSAFFCAREERKPGIYQAKKVAESDIQFTFYGDRKPTQFFLSGDRLEAANGTLMFCGRAHRASPQALIVGYAGRSALSRIDRYGNPYYCLDYVK